MKTRKTLIVRVTGLRRTVPRTMETGLVFFFFLIIFMCILPGGKKKYRPGRTLEMFALFGGRCTRNNYSTHY